MKYANDHMGGENVVCEKKKKKKLDRLFFCASFRGREILFIYFDFFFIFEMFVRSVE